MDKKLFGIRVSTYLQLLLCFIVAFCVWFFAKYVELSEIKETVVSITDGFQ